MRADTPFVLRDRWRCRELLATTATATVWRADDRLLARPVAVRILEPNGVTPHASERAARLLTVAGRLEHPNVACIFDTFEDPETGLVVISELIEGPTLHELLDHRGRLPVEVVAAVGVQLAEGAAAIHAAEAVHRDLSPANVRVTHDGTVKILGLGAARLLAADGATPMGADLTTVYLAPEQLSGGPTDQRVDIYAIGLILWELAAGTSPPPRAPGAALLAPGSPELVSLRSLDPQTPVRLSEAVRTATRAAPAERWEDARAFAESLRPLCPRRPRAILRDFAADLLPEPPSALTTLTHPDEGSGGT
jgi:eukaryotic-like serine/threonine-protein kinase